MFEPQVFMETSLSVLVGILIGLLVFIVVLPKRPQVTVNRMMGALRTDIVRLCLRDRVPSPSAFNSLAYDRINQLMPILRTMREAGETLLDDALSSVTLGAEIIRLRRLLLWGRLEHNIADRSPSPCVPAIPWPQRPEPVSGWPNRPRRAQAAR